MNRILRVVVLICSAVLVGAGVASADTLQFVLSGPVSASFDLSSSLSIGTGNFDTGFGFVTTPTNLVVNGAASGDFLAFYNGAPAIGGGLGIFESGSINDAYAWGTQIYGGTESSPTFAPGVFSLIDGNVATSVVGDYTLTITDLTNVSTPEPSVTILLVIGLLAVGLAILRFKPNPGITAS